MSQIGECQTRLNWSWKGLGMKCRLDYSPLNLEFHFLGVRIVSASSVMRDHSLGDLRSVKVSRCPETHGR